MPPILPMRSMIRSTVAVTTAAKAPAMMNGDGELDEVAAEDEVLESGHVPLDASRRSAIVTKVRTEASAIRGRPRSGCAPTTTSRPARPRSADLGGSVGQRQHRYAGGDVSAERPCGSAETRSIRSPTRSSPAMPASGSRTGTRDQPGVAVGERRPDQAHVGQRLAGAQRSGEGAAGRLLCEALRDRAGGEAGAGVRPGPRRPLRQAGHGRPRAPPRWAAARPSRRAGRPRRRPRSADRRAAAGGRAPHGARRDGRS